MAWIRISKLSGVNKLFIFRAFANMASGILPVGSISERKQTKKYIANLELESFMKMVKALRR